MNGLVISEKMKGQIRGMQQAERNVKDGISLIQTAMEEACASYKLDCDRCERPIGILTNGSFSKFHAKINQIV